MVRFLLAASLTLIATIHVQAQVFTDNFDRPDSADLGPNYTNVGTASATRVISNQAGNVAGANNLSLVTLGNFSSTYDNTVVTADIFHTGVTGIGFAALAFGHNGVNAAGNGLYIKVQANTAATTAFNAIGFYTGVGNSSTTPWSDPPVFFTIATTFTSARMSVFASDATTINLTLDTNFDGTPDQTFVRHMNLANMVFGTQAGLGVFGTNIRIDNFSASPVPEPGSLLLLGSGIAIGGRYLRRRSI
jgi:PEP-CTERM motif